MKERFMKNGVFSLEYDKETLKDMVLTLQEENKQLKDNWNKLKEIAKSQSGFKKRADLKGGLWFEIDDLLQILEKGESNE